MFFQRFLRMKKILLLVNNKEIKKYKNKNNKKICVVGVSSNVGVTHLSLSLANFLHSVMGQKVIYIELGKQSQLLSVVGMKQVLIGDLLGYEYKGVKYLLSDDIDSISSLMSIEKAWFVVDMEELNEETKTIFTNSNNRIVIGSLSPWCQREYYEYIDNNNLKNYDTGQMTFIVSNINRDKREKTSQNFNQYVKSTIKRMPIINDPFSLKEDYFDDLMDLIWVAAGRSCGDRK